MAPRKTRLPAVIGAAAAAAAVAYLVYSFVAKSNSDQDTFDSSVQSSSKSSTKSPKSTATNSKITVVVSQELVQSQLVDFKHLMSVHPNLVVIVPPMVANKFHRALKSSVGHDHGVKVIRCDTDVGVIHVIKHIRPDLALIADGVGDNIQGEIKRFVGSSEALSGDVNLAAERLTGL
ncbi:peroxisomal biogenesis protein family-domain-containing protein [Yarrowia lipolytica]|jgi:hypothetical protein|uniref:Peroxisome assembly protein 22 n=2 Tax=Yarrowia lipolytica TaxID=4952 RepID=Q6C2P3_YARLI|nr:YALI0F06226p [Yarrowia lipolytica CLIB122]AOW06746.1 hypothetical protein YALI1_F09289g [Yarrowia lipolytica]KAB8284849.1 peroxisomal biogenesis protein family-domain-containing protein [Yarrowia lipolytica]KAE8174737.1 peroxisomal biogenesis protein family-domain-containing protein [Yarrowia lipolytica]KAJ8056046.1 peroxisomal biogenesis protein family-domain-containing protein [Yarrowia lipolytica]QNQ00577.1 Hypothetical protein YALI2_F00122g [Yarrowia lipolytica]|eukprot:XP_505069.2 YALI0F06226p [Yarrowia lipolytica CLIB122]